MTREQLAEAYADASLGAVVDPVTGALTRYYFETQFPIEVGRAHRDKGELSLLLADCDNFKRVNDMYQSHDVGGWVLARIADIFQGETHRSTDMVCKYGGDEFAIVLPATPVANAVEMAESFRKMVQYHTFERRPVDVDGLPLDFKELPSGIITLSIGVSGYDASRGDVKASKLFAEADEAMYQAKEAGRNCVRLYVPDRGIREPQRMVCRTDYSI